MTETLPCARLLYPANRFLNWWSLGFLFRKTVMASTSVTKPTMILGKGYQYRALHLPKMTECLQKAVKSKGIRIFDQMQVIRVLTGRAITGLLCLDLSSLDDPDRRFVAFNCKSVIYATGGPAGIYANSAYPESQLGSTGVALEAGVMGRNLTEWQYGLASLRPRWNVSGTYMQVLPRFISTNQEGKDAREFLQDYFPHQSDLLSRIFLKGYEWPFDVSRVVGGSSLIDILVHQETSSGRRVFLDYRKIPVVGKDSL